MFTADTNHYPPRQLLNNSSLSSDDHVITKGALQRLTNDPLLIPLPSLLRTCFNYFLAATCLSAALTVILALIF